MTILDEVLKEEYDRLSRGIGLVREELAGLPKGYISEKKNRQKHLLLFAKAGAGQDRIQTHQKR